jgi:hypothetical protein
VAKLSIADLARVRQALALLSEDPVPAVGQPNGAVPSLGVTSEQPEPETHDDDDEADTSPLPVVLPGTTAPPPSDSAEKPRGPFEPARPSQQDAAAEPDPEPVPADSLPPAAAAKLDQIKDLLLTAEAIGEQNLDQHFDQVSQRQRELIREFFEQAQPGRDAPA